MSWRIRFVVLMLLFTGIFLATYNDAIQGRLLAPLTRATVLTTATLLEWSGVQAQVDGAHISHPGGFRYRIGYRCTGFLPIAFLTAALFSFPAPLRLRILGLLAGVTLFLALNLTRLVHLFHLGIESPAAFDFAHQGPWRAAVLLAIPGTWWAWSRCLPDPKRGDCS